MDIEKEVLASEMSCSISRYLVSYVWFGNVRKSSALARSKAQACSSHGKALWFLIFFERNQEACSESTSDWAILRPPSRMLMTWAGIVRRCSKKNISTMSQYFIYFSYMFIVFSIEGNVCACAQHCAAHVSTHVSIHLHLFAYAIICLQISANASATRARACESCVQLGSIGSHWVP